MGQKSTRIDDSALPTQIMATKETLIYNLDQHEALNDLTRSVEKKNALFRNFSFKQNELKNTNLKKNSSEVFTSQLKNYPKPPMSPKHVRIEEEETHHVNKRPTVQTTFVNNFYVFLNKENIFRQKSNRSISYYIPEEISENPSRQQSNGRTQRSKSIPEITESIISKLDLYKVQEFTDLELKTIKLTYKFIQDDLNNVGVIAFMKSFETLPIMKDEFDSFKFLPIDELSKSHALRTHSKKVMNIIDQFVNSLENCQLETMKQKLFHLGERHHIYRAKKEYFLIIEYQFINAIRPIITKNLQITQKNKLVEINEEFSIAFDDRPHKMPHEDFYIDAYLNNEEIERAFDLIQLIWHKIFEVIRFYMNLGMDSFDAKVKS
ncbi:unnamed protein product [Brachionus calyciflorus]|uniref:Globin domain-containing protein n=1 Tax=Brachionus calyciflorus TaxID=104777 RepID=A0A814K6T9_9BILA|nr:unnamed protein product [Brachionus calyciflorus]